MTTDEFALRFKNWTKADEYINLNNNDPKSTHIAGHNHLSDKTDVEYVKMLGTVDHSEADN